MKPFVFWLSRVLVIPYNIAYCCVPSRKRRLCVPHDAGWQGQIAGSELDV